MIICYRQIAGWVLTCILCITTLIPSYGQGEFRPGQLIVQLKHKVPLTNFLEEFNEMYPGAELHDTRNLSRRINIWLLEFDTSALTNDEALKAVRELDDVDIAQFNFTGTRLRATPNDTSFSKQWYLHNDGTNGGAGLSDMNALSAWDISTGGVTPLGDTIVVAVVDAGCDVNQQDIAPNLFMNRNEVPFDGVDDDQNGYIDDLYGWDAIADSWFIPASHHGTRVTGLVGAKGNNTTGISGVNWDVKLMPIRGATSDVAVVIAGYAYALEMRARYDETDGEEGAYVVATNSSFGINNGNPANYPLWCAFYDTLGTYGIISVGSVSNTGVDVDVNGDIPCNCSSDYLIGVANTTSSDVLNNSSSYGVLNVDLAAPGSNIFSTMMLDNYGFATGTSESAPLVSGAIALMYSVLCEDLQLVFKDDPAGLATLVRHALLTEGVDTLSSLQSKVATGGRLNLRKSLEAMFVDSCLFLAPHLNNPGCGVCDGSITVTPYGGTSPFSYQWDDPMMQSTSTATGLCAGVYHVTVTDGNGETAVREYLLNTLTPPQASIITNATLCFNGTDGSAEGSDTTLNYSWSSGGDSFLETNLSDGFYFVTITDGSNCAQIEKFTIEQPDSISLNAVVIDESAFNVGDGSISLSVSGGTMPYTYLWSSGETADSIGPLAMGGYTVTVTDVNGCNSVEDYWIGAPASVGAANNDLDQIFIFPNPAKDKANFQVTGEYGFQGTITVTDVRGVKVLKIGEVQLEQYQSLEVNLSDFSRGVYLLSWKSNSTSGIIKLVKR